MPRIDETTFVLHGLDQDNRIVRAAVFAQKLSTLVKALRVADKIVNGKNAFDYVISNLGTGSAAITVREKQRTRRQHNHSSIAYFETVAVAVYNGDRSIEHLPAPVIKQVEKLGNGAAIKFSHAELAFSDDTVIRIDDYLLHQSEVALEIVSEPNRKIVNNFYRGLTMGSFDGVLKEIDARGTMLRGKLILSAGGREIDCVMNKDRVPEARESFDKRVVIEGTAHYDGVSQLPSRIDVRTIRIISDKADLLRWRGAFHSVEPHEADEDW